ncbi:hypothetical protein LCGC14_2748720, partial [marine sediment metagenome]
MSRDELKVTAIILGILAMIMTTGRKVHVAPAAEATTAPAGLAAKYPGDKGIARDRAVLLHEDFESGRIDPGKWPSVSNRAGALKIVHDKPNVHRGRGALRITARIGKNTGGHL